MNRLVQRAPVESKAFGSKARSRLVLSMYNIRAAAFFRLITNVETQNDFLTLLHDLRHVAWFEFTDIGTPTEIRDGALSIDEGIARRKRWWVRRGYKRLSTLAAASRMSEIQSDGLKIHDNATAIGHVEAGRQTKQPAVTGLVQGKPREKKVSRRNRTYETIDKALLEISKARPKSHQEVFRFLNDRNVVIANRQPFKANGRWLKGFDQDPHRASVWLSQAWRRLGLPAFARGPKK